MSPPKNPNVDGASVTAHGESSLPRVMKRWRTLVPGANMSTNPLPLPATSSCLAPFCCGNVTNSAPATLCSPKGAKPAGTAGSRRTSTKLKCVSKTSMVPNRKLLAYRNLPAGVVTSVRPLYTAPTSPTVSTAFERSTAMTVCVGSTFGFQPEMVPSSVAKRKNAGPDLPFFVIVKSVLVLSKVLKACPVDALTVPDGADRGAAMVTTSEPVGPGGNGLPFP